MYSRGIGNKEGFASEKVLNVYTTLLKWTSFEVNCIGLKSVLKRWKHFHEKIVNAQNTTIQNMKYCGQANILFKIWILLCMYQAYKPSIQKKC